MTKTSQKESRRVQELVKELKNMEKEDQSQVQIKDAQGRLYCREEHCDQPAVTLEYCRCHYLGLWKYLQTRKQIFQEDYLSKTISSLCKSFGETGLQFILNDLKSDKSFDLAVKEMGAVGGDYQ